MTGIGDVKSHVSSCSKHSDVNLGRKGRPLAIVSYKEAVGSILGLLILHTLSHTQSIEGIQRLKARHICLLSLFRKQQQSKCLPKEVVVATQPNPVNQGPPPRAAGCDTYECYYKYSPEGKGWQHGWVIQKGSICETCRVRIIYD